MSPLGDQFPEEFKKKFAQQNLKIGSVIRAFVQDTNPPKIKRFIIIGISPDKLALGTLYINSEINPTVFHTEELRRLHIKFEVSGRDFLEHESYVDCSKIYEKAFDDIAELLIQDQSNHIGDLADSDLKLIKHTVKGAKTISVRTKKKYSLF